MNCNFSSFLALLFWKRIVHWAWYGSYEQVANFYAVSTMKEQVFEFFLTKMGVRFVFFSCTPKTEVLSLMIVSIVVSLHAVVLLFWYKKCLNREYCLRMSILGSHSNLQPAPKVGFRVFRVWKWVPIWEVIGGAQEALQCLVYCSQHADRNRNQQININEKHWYYVCPRNCIVQPAHEGSFRSFGAGCFIEMVLLCHHPSEHVLVRGENGFLPKKAIYQTLPKVS